MKIEHISIDETSVRVYYDVQTWIVFKRFGDDGLYCGNTQSCCNLDYLASDARKAAINALQLGTLQSL
jgi:hypothetical protein